MQISSGGPFDIQLYILYICIYVQEYTDVSKCKLILKWYMNKIQTTEETNLLDYNEEEKKEDVLLSIDEHGILYWFNALSNFDFIQKV